MPTLQDIGVVLLSYLLGSIPFGLLIVKLKTGKDIRMVESGRTGGTNVMRAAGFWSGLLTAILDILKGACAVWLARAVGGGVWIEIMAPLAAILGHNYSIFLVERMDDGRLRLRGGAGGAPSVGGAFGLWAPSILIIFPVGLLIFFGVGYASVTTMSAALIAMVIFAVRTWLGLSPWQYILYGVLAEILLMWALRPNIKRLLAGNERLHGWRAKHQKWGAGDAEPDDIENK
ncbi:MAG: glycerol-3-phosphate acyltransferase [Chloroflexi bacterium]|nr:glycerol-3-phosphate acyltransferase [Chloroflexota bacterium]